MLFKTSLDGLTKGITIGTAILFAGTIVAKGFKAFPEISMGTVLLSIFLLVVFIACFLLRPIHYELTSDRVIIHTLMHDWKIDRKNIVQTKEVDKNSIRMSIRILGVGGLFGYFGLFSNMSLGNFRMFGTRRDRAVLIETHTDKKYILTPDSPADFVDQLNKGNVTG